MRARTPEETLAALAGLDEAAADAEMRSVLAMSRAEIHAELRAAGVDVAALEAKARALVAPKGGSRAPRGEALGVVIPMAASPRSRAHLMEVVAWTAAAAATVPVVTYFTLRHTRPQDSAIIVRDPEERRGESATVHAERLRRQAATDCDLGSWGSCEDDLDEAKGLDPAGEGDPEVQALRHKVDEMTHLPPDYGKYEKKRAR